MRLQRKKKSNSSRRRYSQRTSPSSPIHTSTPAVPWWILKTSFKVQLYSCLCFVAISSCFIFGMSPYTIILALVLSTLKWILSEPNRSVNKDFYKRPRRFLLTGSASGMSQHLTKKLISQGHYVMATDIMYEELLQQFSSHVDSGRVLVRKLNVTNPENWSEVMDLCVEKWGGLDVVFNIAGVLCPHKIQDVTLKEINLQLDVNIKGVVLGTCSSKMFPCYER